MFNAITHFNFFSLFRAILLSGFMFLSLGEGLQANEKVMTSFFAITWKKNEDKLLCQVDDDTSLKTLKTAPMTRLRKNNFNASKLTFFVENTKGERSQIGMLNLHQAPPLIVAEKTAKNELKKTSTALDFILFKKRLNGSYQIVPIYKTDASHFGNITVHNLTNREMKVSLASKQLDLAPEGAVCFSPNAKSGASLNFKIQHEFGGRSRYLVRNTLRQNNSKKLLIFIAEKKAKHNRFFTETKSMVYYKEEKNQISTSGNKE